MQISKITIENLFGDLNYEIALKLGEVATIIYAPNGYGKTTVLEIIDAIFHLDLSVLSRHLFSRAVVEFADQSYLEILSESGILFNSDRWLHYLCSSRGHEALISISLDNLCQRRRINVTQACGSVEPCPEVVL